MDRRTVNLAILANIGVSATGLTGGCAVLKLDGGVTPSLLDCTKLPDIVDRSMCRQAGLRSQATGYVTVGMMVGAAVGAAAAPLLKVNPLLPILIGAVAGGSIAAADLYFQYRLEQANGDALRAFQDVQRDINTDLQRSYSTLEDIKIARVESEKALSDVSKSLFEQSAKLEKVHLLATEINKNKITYQKCAPIYIDTEKYSRQPLTKQSRGAISELKGNGSAIESEEKKYMSLQRQSGHQR